MIDHLDLFEYSAALARHTDPDTSHAAARDVAGAIASALERRVLAAIKGSPQGLTNHEIVAITGLTWNTATPRIRPLVRKHLVYDSGERRSGETNRKCIVWKAI
jgi:hypothetical protein